ncbi:hypothetical protein EDC14_100165 [Hydrogenispora ethanolica]|jgi:hypothetical protein|uniref:Uncharacterized protein n=1 Tax=Hydrogenispora ethanolica TaxID=1082276 RepID=A0A4R1SB62_HYDET|nr:hypothetical protein [Hydrogenispora ethanolica]TCL76785.1 hypothetical protein EDC14_100165 [Hydrogenispora ethanolica]
MKFGKINKQQLMLAAVAFLVTVGALFGGQALNSKFRVADPLHKEVLAIQGVQRFTVHEEKNRLRAELQLAKVADLQQVLERVDGAVQRYYGRPLDEYRIADRSDARLRTARYQLSFYLEEAQVSGSYIQLKEELDALTGVKARVYLGQNFIFIQMENGSHYLYQALPRAERTAAAGNPAANPTGGGSV